ncbi:MAG: undecaprenyl/decaprenyl-phosphate alpha-N-acetylglucosaminyl 1-phosphate transferase [Bacteroidales bacterium]|nr:undecaprenyl/decaprenyl-phosphate alpha-N-acetylglucosaminyl 1-phosphate transferase [Bacteroidales bacterium]
MTNFWIANCLLAFGLAVLCAGVLIPQILLISFRKALFDEPDARKTHTSAVPRLGGLAFMPVVCFTFVLLFGMDLHFDGTQFLRYAMPYLKPLAFAACALMMLYIVGMADDLVGVKYHAKFVVQVTCACLIIGGGVWFNTFGGFFGIYEVGPWLGWPMTVLATVFIINSINLIDGIDGLASGLCSICLLCYGIVYGMAGEWVFAILSFASVGVLVPFFYYNVFGDALRQKKIFMGDTGSLTIGMMISFLGIRMLQIDAPMQLGNMNMLVVAFSPLIVPCFDVVRVYGERLSVRRNPFLPDKRHIHHKLLALGWPQRRAMVTLICVSLLFSVANIAASLWVNINILLVIDALIWVVAILALNKRIARRKAMLSVKATSSVTNNRRVS